MHGLVGMIPFWKTKHAHVGHFVDGEATGADSEMGFVKHGTACENNGLT